MLIARRAATIDVLAGGRLMLGLGQGWSKDEHDAMGVAMGDRAAPADEFLEVTRRAWVDDVVEFDGDFFQIPASVVDLKPIQRPHPPIYLAAFTPGAMKRVATSADGWTPVMWPTDQLSAGMDGIKAMAREAGRNPDDIKLVVRGNVYLTPEPLEGRGAFTGSWDQIVSDIKETEAAGADELFVEPQGDSPEEFISLMERVRVAVG